MAAPTNTVTAVTPNIGVREDLEDVIYRVAPENTPFVSTIGTIKASNIYHEWQTENLATPSATNAQLEGDDYSIGTPNLTTRLGNYMQIVAKTGAVARTQDVVNKAGRDTEMGRQVVLKGIELRRDFETRAIGNFASNVESGATPRRTAGILAFLTTNASRGATGANGGFSGGVVAAATNGTQRTFTEALLKSVMATVYASSGETMGYQAYMGPTQKQTASTFTGIASNRADVKGTEQATIYGAADVYISDFGAISFIPHPYGLTRDVLILNPKMAAIATLDGVKKKMLASNGDNEKFLLTMEKGVVCRNERAHGVIADLT